MPVKSSNFDKIYFGCDAFLAIQARFLQVYKVCGIEGVMRH